MPLFLQPTQASFELPESGLFVSERHAQAACGLTRLRRHSRPSRRGLLEGLGAYVAEMAVLTISIVEDFDVIEDFGAGQIAGLVDALSDPFLLQAAEKRFGHGIVPTVAAPTHARLQVVSGTEAPPVVATVLRALIRMHQCGFRQWLTSVPTTLDQCVGFDQQGQRAPWLVVSS